LIQTIEHFGHDTSSNFNRIVPGYILCTSVLLFFSTHKE